MYKKLLSIIKSTPILHGVTKFFYMIYATVKNRSLSTLTFSPPGHFYSPLPDLSYVKANSSRIFDQPKRVSQLPGVDLRPKQQLKLLGEFRQYYADMDISGHRTDRSRYYYENPYFGDGDATILYSFLRHLKPGQLVEVGSGFSSALILDIREQFFQEDLKLTFIEPFSDRLLGLLNSQDQNNCQLIEKPVQQVPDNIFEALNKDDILFVDSSHIAKIDSDVIHIISRVLPALKSGVVIHFHDILWPFEYPEDWVEQGISWNEAYFLRAFLQYNNAFDIVYFNSYIAEFFSDELSNCFSNSVKNSGGSIWLRKK